jgi:hypothetical protein
MNINELLKQKYTLKDGRWQRKGSNDLLSMDNLWNLLRPKCNKPVIKEIVLSIFKYTVSNPSYTIVMYPTIGSHSDQALHANESRVSVDYSTDDIDYEISFSVTDTQVLLGQINEGLFDKVVRIVPGPMGSATMTIVLNEFRVGNKCGSVELFINVIDGTISLSKIRFRPPKRS